MTTRTRTRSPRPAPSKPAIAKDLPEVEGFTEPVGVGAVAALEHEGEPDEIRIGDIVFRKNPDAVLHPDGWKAALAWLATYTAAPAVGDEDVDSE